MGAGLCAPACSHDQVTPVYTDRLPGCVADKDHNRIAVDHCLLEQLPHEVFLEWVLPFLSVKGLVRLISAVNGELMVEDLVGRLRVIYTSERNMTLLGNRGKETWLLARQIYPANVKVFCGLTDDELRAKRHITRNAKVVSLNYCWMLSTNAISNFLSHCHNLTTLDLTYCVVKAPILNTVAMDCPRLQTLLLHHAQKVSYRGLREVTVNCSQLTDLRMSYSSGITPHEFIPLTPHFARLTTLHVAGMGAETTFALSSLVTAAPGLVALDVSHCRYAVGVHCLAALSRCPTLRVLYAACSVHGGTVDAAAITPLLMDCPQLEVLDLSGYSLLTVGAVLAIAQHGRRLQRLLLDRCAAVRDSTLLGIAQRTTSLREFSCRQCPGVTASGVAAFSAACSRYCRVYFGEVATALADSPV